jgi:hypothetical protein
MISGIVPLTNYRTMGQYNNLGWMPVLEKYTGCPVQVQVQQENNYSNTSMSCWYEPNRKTGAQYARTNMRAK